MQPRALLAVAALLVCCQLASAASRDLLQTGTCLSKIPYCDPGRCTTATVAGALASVCARCKTGFVRSADGLNCVCPPGMYEKDGACVACGQAFFCPGGNTQAKNAAPATQYGQRFSCNKAVVDATITSDAVKAAGLTTKSERARKHTDCVPMPGYFLSVATRANQAAEPCPANTYSPGYTRLRSCLKCQSGLQERPGFTGLRTDKVAVCGVPEGRYLSQNVVRFCPKSTFRAGWVVTTDLAARFCHPCPKGITTSGTESTQPSDCNIALPGYQVSADWLTGVGAQTDGATGLPTEEPPLCPRGSFFGGGAVPTSTTGVTCQPCPLGTTTQEEGATSADDCMVPPGYFLSVTGSVTSPGTGLLVKCPTSGVIVDGTEQGSYRADWKPWKDESVRSTGNGADACTLCGNGILSALTDVNELAPTDTSNLVATSPASCYIEAGWGITPVPMAVNKWQASLCAKNSYGVEARTYGLNQAPCKPCQRNMITAAAGANKFTDCINPDGYGVSTDGVSQCPQGSYAAQGTMLPCTPCAPGRTTKDQPAAPAPYDQTLQDEPADCIVAPGNGVVGVPDNTAADVTLSVIECPIGTFSTGGTISTVCTACTSGYSTIDQGTIGSDNTACTKCAAGYGRTTAGTSFTCLDCPYGTFQTGYSGVVTLSRPGDGEICLGCARSQFTYLGSRGRKGSYESEGITLYTKSRGPEACVPRMQQLLIDAGQGFALPAAVFTANAAAAAATTASACIAAGRDASNAGQAAFVSFSYDGTATDESLVASSCKVAIIDLAPKAQSSSVLLVKLIPSDPIGAASVNAKSMASGLYARLDLATTSWAGSAVTSIGQAIASATNLALSEPACKRRCDMDSMCWGARIGTAGTCTLVTGEDSLDTRSFFYNPEPLVLADREW